MIELAGVSRRYGALVALAKLDLVLESGRTSVLIGSSGSGKSTVLRLLMGLVIPDTGSVRIGGERVEPASLGRIRRRIGYVPQDGGLFPHLTAHRNVTLMAAQLRQSPAHIEARVGELAELVSLPLGTLQRYPAELSGGQRQRVSLMRALMLDPELLLLDEPLAALDPLIRVGLQADLRAIFRGLRKTVVLVTHDLAEAAYLGDRLVLLRAGRVVQAGTFAELVHKPSDPFVSAFIQAQRSPLDALDEVP
jgi:osmoprotectant transport system ATP-binding protein